MMLLKQFEKLREERDRLIHIAQVEEFALHTKPEVVSIEELAKESLYGNVADVTKTN